ncbi:hypothetical protein Ga0123462_1619 [Mariprofundus ferrinatatus]|uniref:Uncharacterized protein n=1 Tax=Mariprofundus ferrinatatus TaxID=1921087 RepID=A0A2K8L5C2_9PROT|nr:hypothetical protein [Mariprofundus ferrinatatus]ATX82477.1 hypothetical protein Ga0123462_1619 [Mariprofundus ferrinatatus]
MNNAIGIILVFFILVAVVVVTNWQEKTGKKLSDFTWYRYAKWLVLSVLVLGVLSVLILSIYGAATL